MFEVMPRAAWLERGYRADQISPLMTTEGFNPARPQTGACGQSCERPKMNTKMDALLIDEPEQKRRALAIVRTHLHGLRVADAHNVLRTVGQLVNMGSILDVESAPFALSVSAVEGLESDPASP
jgi:hypothetical protein